MRRKKPEGVKIKSAIAAVSGNLADDYAVRFAAQIAERRRGSLYIVHVIEVERSLPVDSELPFHTAAGNDLLDRMEDVTKRFKCKVSLELLQARLAGPAIVHEAAERDVDAVVIGIPYKTKYGKFTLGEAVPYILEHAPCRVVLLRGEIPQEPGDDWAASNHSTLSEAQHGASR